MSEIVFLGEDEKQTARVFALGRRERIQSLGGCAEGLIKKGDLEARKRELADAKYAFCTWGVPEFTREEIARYLPSLKCVFYAAGSVQGFARGFLQSGVRVFSAACVNAVPVAETVFAQITLANKGFFHTLGSSSYAEKLERTLQFQGNFATTVGLVGLGAIGSMVAEKLKALSVRVIAYDKFANNEKYISLGAEKADLNTLFSESDVISNHLADNGQTRGMLDYSLFSHMKKNAVFINSGRGRQVAEADLARALEEERGRFAILDVTFPEPPEENSPLLSIENVLLTPHIDGSWGNEVVRMADCMIESFEEIRAGKSPNTEVTEAMLATMA